MIDDSEWLQAHIDDLMSVRPLVCANRTLGADAAPLSDSVPIAGRADPPVSGNGRVSLTRAVGGELEVRSRYA
jgi:hypothetical protein